MAKVKNKKVSIKVSKIDQNGQKRVENKTFSRNNKRFKKEVEDSKVLLEEANAFTFVQNSNDIDNQQKESDKQEYVELIKDIDETESYLFDSKLYFQKSWNSLVSFVYIFKYLGLGIWMYFKYLYSKNK